MKKTTENEITLTLVKNPDILKELCLKKHSANMVDKPPLIIGFCAESENLLENAKEKINKKGCDYLIANDISRKDIGFSSDFNEVTILDKNGGMKKLERASKKTIAKEIFNYIKF
ncbi:phosphopantothenoylcysteine decarboxylase/phosphopantothenate/cysteine ligase [Clostridium sp. CAG:715]|nr:phosphopantothenoylcysteine decarboxylase/phosphopantothenate/cysteine ligase [Clostridium sp. CAG:715]